MRREPALESGDLLLQSIDTLLGGPDESSAQEGARPGFGSHDFRQLRRMLFWPSLISIALASWALLEGLSSS